MKTRELQIGDTADPPVGEHVHADIGIIYPRQLRN